MCFNIYIFFWRSHFWSRGTGTPITRATHGVGLHLMPPNGRSVVSFTVRRNVSPQRRQVGRRRLPTQRIHRYGVLALLLTDLFRRPAVPARILRPAGRLPITYADDVDGRSSRDHAKMLARGARGAGDGEEPVGALALARRGRGGAGMAWRSLGRTTARACSTRTS